MRNPFKTTTGNVRISFFNTRHKELCEAFTMTAFMLAIGQIDEDDVDNLVRGHDIVIEDLDKPDTRSIGVFVRNKRGGKNLELVASDMDRDGGEEVVLYTNRADAGCRLKSKDKTLEGKIIANYHEIRQRWEKHHDEPAGKSTGFAGTGVFATSETPATTTPATSTPATAATPATPASSTPQASGAALRHETDDEKKLRIASEELTRNAILAQYAQNRGIIAEEIREMSTVEEMYSIVSREIECLMEQGKTISCILTFIFDLHKLNIKLEPDQMDKVIDTIPFLEAEKAQRVKELIHAVKQSQPEDNDPPNNPPVTLQPLPLPEPVATAAAEPGTKSEPAPATTVAPTPAATPAAASSNDAFAARFTPAEEAYPVQYYINGLKQRYPHVTRLLEQHGPDEMLTRTQYNSECEALGLPRMNPPAGES